jgi:hypothetical protein
MLARIFRRIADPPKCLEIDSINREQEQSFSFQPFKQSSDQTHPLPYVIQQKGFGRGLLSLASSVVCHVHVAKRYSLLPYVDLTNHYTEYKDLDHESSAECSTANPWEYYFKPVSSLTYEDARQSPYSLGSSLVFPSGYPRKMLISQVQQLRDIAEAVLKPVDEIECDVQETIRLLAADGLILGVHFRGQEQKTMPYHPLSPTSQQIFSAIDRALDLFGFERIFLATEDLDYLDMLVSRYGPRVFSLPHFRTRSPVNAYRINPRPKHRYLLGREILTDTLILSRCDGMVSSTSNVTEIARAINNGRYRLDLVIDNGLNVHQRWLAPHVWSIKRVLPAKLGGFSDRAITPYPMLND